ncbi:MAG: DUF481 domain-containing protein [Wenzhouxiangella sp.]|nr:DUF481 domain-containing protein [Wenzhouxiangella sp.]MDR9452709.1 DUF481 domain-containing protein [Wenzhouxiangella sp.]
MNLSIRAVWVVLVLALVSTGAVAQTGQWSGSGELGLVFSRGNSDTESANASLEALYERDNWANESRLSGVYSRDSGETSSKRFVAANRTDYRFGEHRYAVGALRYDRDRFSSLKYQASAALGYGYRLLDNKVHVLRVEAGPGLRLSQVRATGEEKNQLIGRAFFDYSWTISETTELENKLLIETGSDNTFAENAAALSVAINARMSLKAGLTVRHNTDVDPGKKKTDTLSTVNLVYNFKPKS